MNPSKRSTVSWMSACAVAIALLAPERSAAHQDPVGDVHPAITVEDGKFVIWFSDNTGEVKGEKKYRGTLATDGTGIEERREVKKFPAAAGRYNPLSPPSAPVQMRLQSPPAKSKFLAVIEHNRITLSLWNSEICSSYTNFNHSRPSLGTMEDNRWNHGITARNLLLAERP